jgi:ketosteroid isomerase-like protein
MDDPRDEIRRVISERIAAIRAKNAEAAVASLADDALAFEMVPPLALPAGAARDAAGFAAWLAGFEEIDVEVRELVIEADEKVAFGAALHRLHGTRVGGIPINLWMRSTLCFRRQVDGWKIAHSHTSVPFYPGPEAKAALDLQPTSQSTD